MSRTGLDGATLANSLRARAGDGSIELVSEPIQASVLLDIADMLEDYESVQGESDYWKHEALRRICTEGELRRVRTARRKDRSENEQLCNENAKLRELLQEALASHEKMCTQRGSCFGCQFFEAEWSRACPIVTVNRSARELGVEVDA